LALGRGRVSNLIGIVLEATGLQAEVGELCEIETGRTRPVVPAEVVGFRDGRTLLMPLGPLDGIGPGKRVSASGRPFGLAVGDELLGRVLDGLGRPIDDGPPLPPYAQRSTEAPPPVRQRSARGAGGAGGAAAARPQRAPAGVPPRPSLPPPRRADTPPAGRRGAPPTRTAARSRSGASKRLSPEAGTARSESRRR